MAFFEMKYHSDALKIGVSVNVILPEKAKTLIGMTANGASAPTYKTLYLFHGLSDDHSIWMRRTSIERYASDYGIAVVMPSVGRSWYTDTPSGAKYLTFVTEELPRVCQSYFRGMSDKREDNMVAGLSMGGYGAFKLALRNPDRYAAAASLSGCLDLAMRMTTKGVKWHDVAVCNWGENYKESFPNSENDLFFLLDHFPADAPKPRIYFTCGTEDGLYDENLSFREKISGSDFTYHYDEGPGVHNWDFWDGWILPAIDWMIRPE